MATRAPKSTDESTVPVGALIPQPRGGALRNGGTNRGGTGRPPNELRATLRQGIEPELRRMEAAVRKIDKLGDPEKSLAAHKALAEFRAKYGLGTTVTETDTKGRDVHRIDVVRRLIPAGPHDGN